MSVAPLKTINSLPSLYEVNLYLAADSARSLYFVFQIHGLHSAGNLRFPLQLSAHISSVILVSRGKHSVLLFHPIRLALTLLGDSLSLVLLSQALLCNQ